MWKNNEKISRAERFYQEIDKYVEEYMNNSGDKSIECPDIDQVFCDKQSSEEKSIWSLL